MDANEPGLFELPDLGPPALSARSRRGRNRETWARTATAEVRIVDAGALREALARVEQDALTIDVRADLADVVPEQDNVLSAIDAFDALAWLIWPTDGLDELLEAGALRILSVESEAVAESKNQGRATWTVTVKLTDVDQLRRLALQANPEDAGSIAHDLAVAWRNAADPFAPLRSIPGIDWRPGQVNVEHLHKRAAKSH